MAKRAKGVSTTAARLRGLEEIDVGGDTILGVAIGKDPMARWLQEFDAKQAAFERRQDRFLDRLGIDLASVVPEPGARQMFDEGSAEVES